MQINLIWAQAKNRVIGLNGQMPWHLPEDLAHFKKTTLGHPVIMGRKTWDSLPPKFRPLPGRMNIVISSSEDMRENLKKNGTYPAQNLREALLICEQANHGQVWVIGGAQIYAQALPLAQRAVITHIDAAYAGDAFAPELGAGWQEAARSALTSSQGAHLDFVDYRRA
jgi:dihydrofolate reductase